MVKSIAIVGGGYIGVELAKALEGKADVTLIEPNTHFVHAPAMIRAVVEPSVLDGALIPYDNLLKKGKLVRARATAVDGNGVTLDNGKTIAADYIVVATGSSNSMAMKAGAGDIDALRADNAKLNTMLKTAKHITIVGAGAVGTELAGELAHFMPDKKVTLVSSDAALFPSMPAKFGKSIQDKLKAAGVTVITGARAENLESTTTPYTGSVKLNNGKTTAPGLVFPAIGARAASGLLEGLPGAKKTTTNRIKNDGWMRPSSLPNVFAAGDVADNGDAMTIVAVSRQLPWLEKTLKSLIGGKKKVEDLKQYEPWADGKAPFIVPLGPKKGNSFMVLFTAGDGITSMAKGKELFVPKYRKMLGQKK